MSKPPLLTSSDSPQIFNQPHTRQLLLTISACLAPAALWGMVVFGWYAAVVVVLTIAMALSCEVIIIMILKKRWYFDGHAVLTGLLIAMAMPPTVPLYIPLAAAFFAIAIVKWPLGGTGAAWLHPAAAALIFAMLSWPKEMGDFVLPGFFAASPASAASPQAVVRAWMSSNPLGGLSPGDILTSQGFFHSGFDSTIGDFLNSSVFSPLGATISTGYIDAFLGIGPGAIGQVSSILLLIGSIILIGRKVIMWQICAGFFGMFAVLTYIFGGLPFGTGWFSGDVLFFILRGSFLMVLFFIATDLSTSPLTVKGKWIAGAVLGTVCFAVATIGHGADAAIVAVLASNMLTSVIDRQARVRRTRLRR